MLDVGYNQARAFADKALFSQGRALSSDHTAPIADQMGPLA